MAIAPLMGVCSSALQYDITDDGRVTGVLPRRALKDSGLALSASWPILD